MSGYDNNGHAAVEGNLVWEDYWHWALCTESLSDLSGLDGRRDKRFFGFFCKVYMQYFRPQRTRSNPAQDVIVFVIGGGNYVEYQNVMDYGKSRGLSRITYGCTELVSPKQFVEQVEITEYSTE